MLIDTPTFQFSIFVDINFVTWLLIRRRFSRKFNKIDSMSCTITKRRCCRLFQICKIQSLDCLQLTVLSALNTHLIFPQKIFVGIQCSVQNGYGHFLSRTLIKFSIFKSLINFPCNTLYDKWVYEHYEAGSRHDL